LDWTPQKPTARNIRRDYEEIAHWRKEVWLKLKKARRENRMIACVDEAAFYLLPGVTPTCAP